MCIADDAISLASTIKSSFALDINVLPRQRYYHVGATISDAILQAGLNYRHVVEPRVLRLLAQYPKAKTTTGFIKTSAFVGLSKMLDWKDPTKPERILDLAWLLANQGVESEDDIRQLLMTPGSERLLLEIDGIGPKTVDYLKMLVGLSTVAVDRHIKSYVNAAGLPYSSYDDIKLLVSMTADQMGIDHAVLDLAIWKHGAKDVVR